MTTDQSRPATERLTQTRQTLCGAQDCCLVFWPCSAPFAAAQMLTQEGLRKPNYALFSKDGGEVSGKLMAVVPV